MDGHYFLSPLVYYVSLEVNVHFLLQLNSLSICAPPKKEKKRKKTLIKIKHQKECFVKRH